MTWILLIYVVSGYGRALDHIEFKTKELCEAAVKPIKDAEVLPDSFLSGTTYKCIQVKK